MYTVVVRRDDENWYKLNTARSPLHMFKVEYYDAIDAVVPVGCGHLLAPAGTNTEVLEKMLSLWSLGRNDIETNKTSH